MPVSFAFLRFGERYGKAPGGTSGRNLAGRKLRWPPQTAGFEAPCYTRIMEVLAQVRIVLWQGASLWIVDASPAHQRRTQRTDFHAHHAIQIVLGLGGRFRLSARSGSIEGDAVAVRADTPHDFAAEGLIAILFVEPESRSGRAIMANGLKDAAIRSLTHAATADLAAAIAQAARTSSRGDRNRAELVRLGNDLVARLAGETGAHAPDLRIRKVIAWAAGRLDRPVNLADAAAVAGLSPGRLRHLFVEQTGLPLRTYLLWLRLSRGVGLLAAGAALTQAAHEAGFADSAHFSRTFRRMFGIAPTNLQIT